MQRGIKVMAYRDQYFDSLDQASLAGDPKEVARKIADREEIYVMIASIDDGRQGKNGPSGLFDHMSLVKERLLKTGIHDSNMLQAFLLEEGQFILGDCSDSLLCFLEYLEQIDESLDGVIESARKVSNTFFSILEI